MISKKNVLIDDEKKEIFISFLNVRCLIFGEKNNQFFQFGQCVYDSG